MRQKSIQNCIKFIILAGMHDCLLAYPVFAAMLMITKQMGRFEMSYAENDLLRIKKQCMITTTHYALVFNRPIKMY